MKSQESTTKMIAFGGDDGGHGVCASCALELANENKMSVRYEFNDENDGV